MYRPKNVMGRRNDNYRVTEGSIFEDDCEAGQDPPHGAGGPPNRPDRQDRQECQVQADSQDRQERQNHQVLLDVISRLLQLDNETQSNHQSQTVRRCGVSEIVSSVIELIIAIMRFVAIILRR